MYRKASLKKDTALENSQNIYYNINHLNINGFNSSANHSTTSCSKNYRPSCQVQYFGSLLLLAAAEVPFLEHTKSQKTLKCVK